MIAIWKFTRHFGLLGLWLAAASFIYFNYQREQSIPQPHVHYFANDNSNSVLFVLMVMMIEIMMMYLILRPWSYQRSAARALVALVLSLPWTLFSMAVSMHASSAVFLHWMWLVVIDCVIVICGVVSGIAALVTKRKARKAAII